MKPSRIPRLDEAGEFRAHALKRCRIGPGEIWTDPVKGHRVAVIDAADADRLREARVGEARNRRAAGWPEHYFEPRLSDEPLKSR